MGSGPIVLGHDGSPASRRATDECGALFTRHEALVVDVWEAGPGFSIVENVPEIPAVPLDIRGALDTERAPVVQHSTRPVVVAREPKRESRT